jgi:hypothetical protein
MRRFRSSTWAVLATVAVLSVAGRRADAAEAVVAHTPGATTPAPADATIVRLSRLHHAAKREVDLGRVAETAANRPETRAFGTRLVAEFQAIDGRIVATAEPLGVDQARLERIYAGENTAALSREAEDLTRLASEHGDAFDRRFWVIVSHDQLAAADMLAPVAGADARVDPLVAELSNALESSSRVALVAARPVAGPAPVSTPAPAVPSQDIPAPPITTPGPYQPSGVLGVPRR